MASSSTSHVPAFDTEFLKRYPFLPASPNASVAERTQLSYERARALARHFDLTAEDIGSLTPRFWDMHLSPVMAYDGAATTLLTIQYNLVVGTLLQYAPSRPDLLPLIDDLLKYRKAGQFMLTERAHGLDAENLETTATSLPSGGFLLETTSSRAAKFMPPTVPIAGVPTVALVFARLIVDGEFRGIRPFITDLNDGVDMSPGVSARVLPQRGATNPLYHSITEFHVRLPSSALLGSPMRSSARHGEFQRLIWRVAIGSLALSMLATSLASVSATIGYRYSLRRTVAHGTPIFSFRTQQEPILVTVAHNHVMLALSKWASALFVSPKTDAQTRHAVATAVKAAIIPRAVHHHLMISERCGAQGLFDHNQVIRLFNETRGISIAEGDTLMLCIRLTMEILLGRCELPPASDPSNLFARRESSLFAEIRTTFRSISAADRMDRINRQILPMCQPFIEAVGHRMAYEAARTYQVAPEVIELYLASEIRRDGAWFAEHGGMGHYEQMHKMGRALDGVLPHTDDLVTALGVEPYVTAPILTDESWKAFEDSLPQFGGRANISSFAHLPDTMPDIRVSSRL